jgi:hypothetical protein
MDLTVSHILAWADAQYQRTGEWPKATSGKVVRVPWETWLAVDSALRHGFRGLPGGDSLARLLRREGRIGERRGRRRQLARLFRARRLRARGLTLREVGRRLGVSQQAVSELLRRHAQADNLKNGQSA